MNKVLSFLLFIFIISGCYSGSKISNKNLSFIYKPDAHFLHPSFRIFHNNDGSSVLQFKFDNKDLLYMKNSNDEFEATFKVSIDFYPSYESSETLDTISEKYSIKNNPQSNSEIYHFIEFNIASLSSYVMKVTIDDINRKSNAISFLSVNKGNKNLPQYFTYKLKDATIPMFRNHISETEEIIIEHSDPAIQKLWVRYYNREFPLAAPPHSLVGTQVFSFVPDSVFSIEVNSGLKFTTPGIYHIQIDTLQKDGLTLFRLENDFPNLTDATQLLEPLRYLTTKSEYDKITSSEDKRMAIDSYWLKLAGSKERARFLIKHYYNRVQVANQFFTSYLEGWKTDRGLIYIIFGVPDGIYKNTNTEVWTYSSNSQSNALIFSFNKISNPFSINDFVLLRKSEYEFDWYKAVETWRKGRIVNL